MEKGCQRKEMKIYRISQDIIDDYDLSWYNYNIARDPNTSPEILKKILEQGKNDIVSCCAARNPNCPVEALEMVLKRGKDDGVSWNAAENPNCPAYLLEMVLKRGNDDLVSSYAAENPNCPASSLEMVLKRGNNDGVSWFAARNPNCPASALEMVLKRGKDDYVSQYAAYNPNCPLKAKIKWMMATGKIGKEDPTKHIIEREEIKEDPDLKKLRDLIASSGKKMFKDYLDIGHGEGEVALWTIIGGKLEVSWDEKERDHVKKWKNMQGNDYRGRFESATKKLSIVNPFEGRNIPNIILRKLYDRFGNDIIISEF